ncbi:spermidine synthase [Luteimonas aquatica]|uniref:spermidine synthase n=1 Tax=Luteimonas aquatica TaxID=450364 RepID=UPI001F57C5F3|nr:fused MFS/spermidine synthase [Luteimonas aquatica]
MRARAWAATVVLLLCAGQAAAFNMHREIYREKSVYRNILVEEGEGYRCMTFGVRDGRQGCIYLADPKRLTLLYSRSYFASFFAVPAPRRVLVLGLGVGTMPMALRAFDPAIQVDSVELDPAVVKVAKEHFGFREDRLSRVYVNDARVFVRKQRRLGVHYDLVMVDAFDVRYIPEHLLTREFMAEIRDVLNPGGIVAANTFSNGPLRRYELATYQSVFGAVMTVQPPQSPNRIILAGRDGLPAAARMRDNARLVAPQLRQFDLDADYLLSALKPAARVTDVRPLTDQYSPANLLLAK